VQRVFFFYCLSGLVSLGYQLVWFAFFADRFGSTALTFLLVLTSFIGALGLGAICSRRVTQRLTASGRLAHWKAICSNASDCSAPPRVRRWLSLLSACFRGAVAISGTYPMLLASPQYYDGSDCCAPSPRLAALPDYLVSPSDRSPMAAV
jgi:hypothetical protein